MSNISILKIILCCLLLVTCTPTALAETLAESDHPYANSYENTWIISEPGAAQIRIHFESLQLGTGSNYRYIGETKFYDTYNPRYDKLILYDKFDNVLMTYGRNEGVNLQGFWTEWYAGDTIKVKLVTDNSGNEYGFRIDNKEIRSDAPSNDPGTGENEISPEIELTPSANPSTTETGNNVPTEQTATESFQTDNPSTTETGNSVPTEQTDTESFQTDNEESILENPIISGIIATVVGGFILAIIKRKPPRDENDR